MCRVTFGEVTQMAGSKIVLCLLKRKDVISPKIDIAEPLSPMRIGELRDVDFTYRPGAPTADAFGMEWYLTEADAEACRDRLTDTENLPTATFTPAVPATDAEPTQDLDGTVRLVAPLAFSKYESFAGKIFIEQQIDAIAAKIDILEPISDLMPGEQRDVPLTYRVGDPPAEAFDMEWYLNEADAEACRDRLTDTENLPTATFTPAVPATDAEPTQDLDGSVRLVAPTSMTYENLFGKAIIVQDVKYHVPGAKFTNKVSSLQPPRRPHRPTWEVH